MPLSLAAPQHLPAKTDNKHAATLAPLPWALALSDGFSLSFPPQVWSLKAKALRTNPNELSGQPNTRYFELKLFLSNLPKDNE